MVICDKDSLLLLLILVFVVAVTAAEVSNSSLTLESKNAEDVEEFDDNNDVSEEDAGDSDISEESNPDDLINNSLQPVKLESIAGEQVDDAISVIHHSFVNRKTFSCPSIKQDFLTGTSTSDLSPEDVGIIAAMGDSLATGKGLWPQTDIEFRGAAFPIGGDATIDGLVTIANILHEFNNKLVGVSHGMGTRSQLPDHQLNVAESGATTSSLPEQATELVRRIHLLKEVNMQTEWTLVIIAIGTEEVCKLCEPPDYNALLKSITTLYSGVQKMLIVLLGPIHVSSSYRQGANLLKSRCGCSTEKSDEFMRNLSKSWASTFSKLQKHFEQPHIKRQKIGLLALPMLTITSRHPYSLFIPNKPLLNRKGHTYATKWLWNRLMTGPAYNLSLAVLSEDAYYCPSMGCPYFRTASNRHRCRVLQHGDVIELDEVTLTDGRRRFERRRSPQKLYLTAVVVVTICFISVLVVGTMIYQKSKYEYRIKEDQKPFGDESSYQLVNEYDPHINSAQSSSGR